MMGTKAKTGDLVRVISTEGSLSFPKLYVNDVVKVLSAENGVVFIDDYKIKWTYSPYFLVDNEYELIENPEDYVAKESVGDDGNLRWVYVQKDRPHKAKKGDLVRATTEGLDVVNAGEVFEVGDIKPSVSGYMHYEMLDSTPENESNVFLFGDEFELLEEESPQQNDAVNHPNHYTQGRFETIEVIEEIAGGYDNGYVAYCVGNAIKYLSRAPHKHATPVEDLRKAATYLDFAIKAETRRAT